MKKLTVGIFFYIKKLKRPPRDILLYIGGIFLLAASSTLLPKELYIEKQNEAFILSASENLPKKAASLYFKIPETSYLVGQEIPVKVNMDPSTALSFNAANIKLKFSSDVLNIKEIIVENSTCPTTFSKSFSNELGVVEITCGSPGNLNPANTAIATIYFTAKTKGTAKLEFDKEASLTTIDNRDTDYASATPSGDYIFIKSSVQHNQATKETPQKISIFSTTHPNQDKWYSNSNVRIAWLKEEGVKEFEYCYSQDPTTCSDKKVTKDSSAILESKDGIWFFKLVAINDYGKSADNTYQLNIDTTPPEELKPEIMESNIKFTSRDSASGVKSNIITIDNQKYENPNGLFAIPLLNKGKYKASIMVKDKAGNVSEHSFVLTVKKSSSTVKNFFSRVFGK